MPTNVWAVNVTIIDCHKMCLLLIMFNIYTCIPSSNKVLTNCYKLLQLRLSKCYKIGLT